MAKAAAVKPSVPKKKRKKSKKQVTESHYRIVEAEIGEDKVVRCPVCGMPLKTMVADYGVKNDNFYFLRICKSCEVRVRYETRADFTLIVPKKAKKAETAGNKFKRIEKPTEKKEEKRKKVFKKVVKMDDFGEDDF